MSKHEDIPIAEQHIIHNWEYANAAARTGASGFVSADIGKVCRQTDTDVWYILTATTPTWQEIGGTLSTAAEIFLSAAGGWPSTTSGCAANVQTEYASNDVDLWSLDFDQTSPEYAQWSIWMPDNYGGGTMTFEVLWTAAAGTPAQTVEWNLEGRAYTNDDPIDASWGTAVEVSDALIATGDIHISVESGAVTLAGSPAGGQFVQFRAWRDAASDSLAADARLLGIKVHYTKA